MKILIADFDGTFLDKNFEENIKFVQDFVEQGNMFIIATGRNITSLKKVISSYNIPFSYLINNDGGIIVDKNYQEIFRLDLEKTLCKDLYLELEKSSIFSSVFIDTGYTYQKEIGENYNRIIGKIIERKESQLFLESLRKKYSEQIYAYLSNNWINITSGKNNKVNAIQWLIESKKLNIKNIYTIGNDENDLEMLLTYHGYMIGHKFNHPMIKNINQFKDIKEIL